MTDASAHMLRRYNLNVYSTEIADVFQRRHITVHRKDAISNDEASAAALALLQTPLQIICIDREQQESRDRKIVSVESKI